ncbi:MAG: tRNA pseudouridine(55) synthase TruB [Chloroflexota bacterium]
MEGVLAVDKPTGMTSHDVVNRVRRLASMRRVGHAGTLDPLATGVLLVCLGRTTRLIEYLVGLQKIYETRIRLGQTTDSYDADGTMTAECAVTVTEAEIESALAGFRGDIEQRPPMFSAIKRNGQPLYKLARQGIEVERPLRPVTIYNLTCLSWKNPYLDLRITCSAGTYIRSLAHDLGTQLGCGGHVAALRRTAIGSFQQTIALDQITPNNLPTLLQASDQTVAHLPRLDLAETEAQRLCQGQKLPRLEDTIDTGMFVRAYDENERFVGIIEAKRDYWQAKKIFLPA